ncbi:Uncharacterized protein APZ42_025309 [Daphnia magna]|uniref:Endonuclease/exonuclease/phosphatase domain-containing protein n=1 Tax=Daphnia magna TaxID=35525 RepID=A0A164T803_9CRUS|nr:Uncharacterized protein APZ42_025309 [Daphnia magna]
MVAETEDTHTGPARVRQPASTHVPESRPYHTMNHQPSSAKRIFVNDSDDEWPTTSNNYNTRTTVSLPPVIIKLIDGKANFRQMEMSELKAIIHDITLQVDKPKRSDSPRGGDIFVYPTDVAQREALLKITHAANRSIRAEQPNSINSNKGIIHRVPTSESETDLLELLAPQGVTKVERFTKLAEGTRVPAGTVALSFNRPLPARVTLVALSFSIFKYYPNPYKCTKCWKLGHTKNYCSTKEDKCKNCGENHIASTACTTKCVNCCSPTHSSDSKQCPTYIEMLALIKYATDHNLPVSEARQEIGISYSSAVSRPSPTPINQANLNEIEKLKTDMRQLQDTLKNLQSITIKDIQSKLAQVATDAANTNTRIDSFEETVIGRFDRLEAFLYARLPPTKAEGYEQPHSILTRATPLWLVQWNTRGLTKSRLEEFRNFLSSSTPSIVLLCETIWNNKFSVKFRTYNLINKNRTDRPGGGVAILVHHLIPYTTLVIRTSPNTEAVGISINVTGYGKIDIISVYCPHGDCTKEEITQLLGSSNTHKTLVGGDPNGHHESWSSNQRPNRSGKSIYSALLETPEFTLITPPKLGTYVNPSTGRTSTLDLTTMSAVLACDATVTLGPYIGSDHLPVIIDNKMLPAHADVNPPKWIFAEGKFPYTWRLSTSPGRPCRHLEEQIKEAMSSTNPFPLNKPITTEEIESVLSCLKSNATGLDLIHNKMLANLNNENREYMRLTFNALLLHGVSPPEWKQATHTAHLPPVNLPKGSYLPVRIERYRQEILRREIGSS